MFGGGDDDDKLCYKVLLIGESCVGKTSIIRFLRGQEFLYSPMCTIGKNYINLLIQSIYLIVIPFLIV